MLQSTVNGVNGSKGASPLVAVSFAASITGYITHPKGETLGSLRDRYQLEWLRCQADALLFGAGTVRIDRRKIQIRQHPALADITAKFPAIFVVCTKNNFDFTTSFWDSECEKNILLLGNDSEQKIPNDKNITLVQLGNNSSINDVISYIYGLGFNRILCEGGGKLFSSLVGENLVDELFLTLTPWIIDKGEQMNVSSIISGPSLVKEVSLISTTVQDKEVFLRYRFQNGRAWPKFEEIL
ncbi:RibD family protein [Alicyclobacillus fastidiosus]|uniref:Dihydrofolate reductase family protein n=1 Tax=Alicyclobacillus fastidiosus TaxID=392011 RepID=A0ABV5AIA2_9BACL|nr:dihydrofolate reductase family protein [Alicyclobacillus fastidiosus]WEH11523.1 dihydrofolate reductase family protein [Alicyclobacillus fastidiosus]